MSKPKSFKLSSDYATTQNDARGTVTYTLPSGTPIASLTRRTFETSVELGTRNAYMRLRGSSSQLPGRWFVGSVLAAYVTVNSPTDGTLNWLQYHAVERTSPTTIRVYTEIFNPLPETVTISGDQTITWQINTFLSPFPT